MILVNYTPDDIKFVHGGIPGILKSGDMDDMPEAKAKFLFNKYDQRGILTLVFGDDIEEKKTQAMEIYKEFWIRQVTMHNQANEARQARKLEYAKPAQELVEHAKILGLELLGPWVARLDTSSEAAQLKNENAELRVMLNQQGVQLANVLAALNKLNPELNLQTPEQQFSAVPAPVPVPEPKPNKEPKPPKIDVEKTADPEVMNIVKGMKKTKYVEWVMDNATPIMNEYDKATQSALKKEWKAKKCSEDWPLPV
jgi:hypothetical protein